LSYLLKYNKIMFFSCLLNLMNNIYQIVFFYDRSTVVDTYKLEYFHQFFHNVCLLRTFTLLRWIWNSFNSFKIVLINSIGQQVIKWTSTRTIFTMMILTQTLFWQALFLVLNSGWKLCQLLGKFVNHLRIWCQWFCY
jgi:hypothetical protein